MKKKPVLEERFRTYAADVIRYCLGETFHNEYTFEVGISKTPKPGDADVAADIDMNSVYLWARVTLYPELFQNYKDKKFRRVGEALLHEVCHLFIDPVSRLFMWDACPSQKNGFHDTIERQTQRIANAIWDLLPNEWYLPENVAKTRSKVKKK